MSIDATLLAFKDDLAKDLDPKFVTQKYLMHGNCHVIDEISYFELKQEISKKFEVHPNEILMVGSGKLGFSIAPRKRFRVFNDESDIDVAIVSNYLFENVWEDLYVFDKDGGYWPKVEKFKAYLFQGWLRPDYLPSQIEFSKEWWEFFNELTNTKKFGPYSIKAGVYKNWFFLEDYIARCVHQCREENDNA